MLSLLSMGMQEIIAVLLLVVAVFFISRRVYMGIKMKPANNACNKCGSDPPLAGKSNVKA